METADIREAALHLPELVDAALRGEQVIIARDGIPAVALLPVPARVGPRRPGRLKGQIVELDPDWWKPDEELIRLFEEGDPEHPDPLFK